MGANVDASEFAKKLPSLVRDIQRARMGRSVNQPLQNVAGAKEIQLANLNKLSGAPQQNVK